MTRFEYAAIFYGILVAMAIETVAMSVHKLFVARARVRWHWMAPVTALNACMVTLAQFWILWIDNETSNHTYTVFQFLPFALSLFLMFLSAAATLPDEVPETGLDLRQYYFDNRIHYWGTVAAYFSLLAILNLVGMLQDGPGSARWNTSLPFEVTDVVTIALCALLIVVRSYWVHAAGILLGTLSLFGFLWFMHLR